VHCNVTAHPTAAWTLQQLREAIPSDHPYRFLIHDPDSIFSAEVDQSSKLLDCGCCTRPRERRKQTPMLGKELVGSHPSQDRLYHWFKSNDWNFCVPQVAAVETQATRRVLMKNRKLVTKREDLRL